VDNPYVYVLVRKDLSYPQRVVQAGHVLWEVSKTMTLDTHPSVIICGSENEKTLEKESLRIERSGLRVFTFREPDLDNKITAIAVVARNIHDRKLLKRYQLLV
jgi:hypothetical protein